MLCLLCRDHCDEDQCRRTKAKAALILMLCAMLDKKKLTISEAQYLYKEIQLRKRICKKHFHEVAIFIGEIVSKVCKTTVQDLFTVPGSAVEEAIAYLDSYRSAIDVRPALCESQLGVLLGEQFRVATCGARCESEVLNQ
ncbi:hypothetical protein GCK32_002053, partial [Trichostrongylus colubriformis]